MFHVNLATYRTAKRAVGVDWEKKEDAKNKSGEDVSPRSRRVLEAREAALKRDRLPYTPKVSHSRRREDMRVYT